MKPIADRPASYEGAIMNKIHLGIDVGGTKIAYGMFDEDGGLLARHQQATPLHIDGPGLCGMLLEGIEDILAQRGANHGDVEGVGIGMPSFILYDEGYILATSALVNIRQFGMKDYLAQRLDIPVFLDNDSNAAALAEYRFGAGRGSRHMIYMSASTGLGSGLILNGQLFRGTYGWAGESGHMLITPDAGVACGCGNQGCFMSWASGRYLPDQIRRMAQGRKTVLDLGPSLGGETLYEACRQGDPLALDALDQLAHYMAICLFNIYQLLNVNLFVFGGGLTHFGPMLFDRVRREFDRYDHMRMPVDFRIAELERDFGIIGAAELVRHDG